MNPKYGYALVEGQTEERFISGFLGPHLESSGLFLRPVVVETSRPASGGAFKGGSVSYESLKRQLGRLLRDKSRQVVTTFFDLYRLPTGFPGLTSTADLRGATRAAALEQSLLDDFGDLRLVPYLSVHEFEALVLATDALCSVFPSELSKVQSLRTSVEHFDPEDIDDGPTTHPSARLAEHLPAYNKPAHGLRVTQRAGLPALRARCPHFDSWVTRLEALAQAP